MSKIQNEDIKSVAELVAAGSTSAHLPNDTKVWVTANGILKTLYQAIVDGDISGSILWSVVTGTSQALTRGHGYIANNAGTRVNFSLPVTAAVGDTFPIAGLGAAGWKVSQNAGQQIIRDVSMSTVGTVSGIESSQKNSCIELVCVVANTTFLVRNSQGATDFFGTLAGWIMGGVNVSNAATKTMDKIDLNAGTVTLASTSLQTECSNGPGVQSTLAGYILSGLVGPGSVGSSDVQKVLFSTGATSTLASIMGSQVNDAGVNGASSSTNGYGFGGSDAGTGVRQTTILKFTFSSETGSTASGSLPSARANIGAGYSSTTAYPIGGDNSSVTPQTTAYKMLFSSEAVSTLGTSLSQATTSLPAVNSSAKSYYGGGILSSDLATNVVQIVTFSGEAVSQLGTTLASSLGVGSGVSGTTIGYWAGGENDRGTPVAVDTVQAIDFGTETLSVASGVLTTPKRVCVGVQG